MVVAFRDYFALLAICWIGGSAIRRIVWATKLDLRLSFLRMRNDWYYSLSYRRVGFTPDSVQTWADILTACPGDARGRLYRGLVKSWEPDEKGGLAHITLSAVGRGEGRGWAFDWKHIPSDDFLILGCHIHSINLQYVVYEPYPGGTQGARWIARRYWRAFRFEEQI
jgi:hypothetical protein